MGIDIHFLFIVFTCSFVSSFNPNDPFCVMPTCPPGAHVMCVHPNNVTSDLCGRIIRRGLTDNEQQKIVTVHNRLRSWVYNGKETRGTPGPQPSAFFDIHIQWNNELARIAQRWADQCSHVGDTCRDVADYVVGQNYITGDYDEDMNEEMELDHLKELVEVWYEEVVRHNGLDTEFRQQRAKNTATLNYTQLVWSDTYEIGCAAMRHQKHIFLVPEIFLVCNYGPGGNRENEPIYVGIYL